MTKRDAGSLGLKLLGVYAVLTALGMVPVFVMGLASLTRSGGQTAAGWWPIAGFLLSVILGLLAGYVLIWHSDRLARRMVAEDSPASTSPAATAPREWQTIAFSVVGLFICLTGLPRLASFAVQLFLANRNTIPEVLRGTNHTLWTNGITAVVQIVLGVAVFLKARALVEFWERRQPPQQ